MNLRKVLILGHGFIGENLAKNLNRAYFKVDILSRTVPEANLGFNQVWTHDLEFLNKNSPIFQNDYDTIFHVASSTTPGSSDLNMPLDVSANLLGTLRFLENLRQPEKTKFVYISSAGTVYGPLEQPATEKSSTNPICSYGITKLAVEKYLALFHQKRGLQYLALRVSNPYGPWNLSRKPFGLINNLIECVISGKPVMIYGSENTSRDFIYIDDLIQGIISAGSSDTSNGVYNLAYCKSHSIGEVLSVLQSECGQFKIEASPAREFDLKNVRIDSSLFQKTFAWKPTTNLAQGIKKTLSYRKFYASDSKP